MSSKKDIVISLFDFTGSACMAYEKAGYTVFKIDIKAGIDIFTWDYKFIPRTQVAVIMAAPPCTDFAVSGSQYWKAKDQDGRTQVSVDLVSKTLEIIDYFQPEAWYIENPTGRLRRMLQGTYLPGEPTIAVPASLTEAVKEPRLTFDPKDFGDPWTKKTCLWGIFNDLERYETEAIQWSEQGSWSQLLGGKSEKTKELRSITPSGFSRHFFNANNPQGAALPEHLYFFGRCRIGMWTCEFAVSKEMCAICDDGDNYEESEYAMEFDTEKDFMLAVFDKGEGIRRHVDPQLF